MTKGIFYFVIDEYGLFSIILISGMKHCDSVFLQITHIKYYYKIMAIIPVLHNISYCLSFYIQLFVSLKPIPLILQPPTTPSPLVTKGRATQNVQVFNCNTATSDTGCNSMEKSRPSQWRTQTMRWWAQGIGTGWQDSQDTFGYNNCLFFFPENPVTGRNPPPCPFPSKFSS